MFGKTTEENPFPESCYNCRFWNKSESELENAECRRRINRTILPKSPSEAPSMSLWAITLHNDWCGDYEQANDY